MYVIAILYIIYIRARHKQRTKNSRQNLDWMPAEFEKPLQEAVSSTGRKSFGRRVAESTGQCMCVYIRMLHLCVYLCVYRVILMSDETLILWVDFNFCRNILNLRAG